MVVSRPIFQVGASLEPAGSQSKTIGEHCPLQGETGPSCVGGFPQAVTSWAGATDSRGPVLSPWATGGFLELKCQEQGRGKEHPSQQALRQSGSNCRRQSPGGHCFSIWILTWLFVYRDSVCAPVCLQICIYANARGGCQVLIYYLFSALFLWDKVSN